MAERKWSDQFADLVQPDGYDPRKDMHSPYDPIYGDGPAMSRPGEPEYDRLYRQLLEGKVQQHKAAPKGDQIIRSGEQKKPRRSSPRRRR